MEQLRVLIFLACVAGLNAGLIRIGGGSARACPGFTTKPDFNYIPYAGVWYEIQKIPNVFEDGLNCVRATYAEIAPNQISVLNTGVFESGLKSNISGTGRQPNPVTEPGHLVVSFPGRPDGTYEVLDTDYISWTAVYSCLSIGAFRFEYAWLMGRNNVLTEQQLADAQAAYRRNGIDVSKFVFTNQNADCVYEP